MTIPLIAASQALTTAEADAMPVYKDLTPYRIEIRLEDEGWHVEYHIKKPRVAGGGPFYVIDSTTGKIVSKKYYQ